MEALIIIAVLGIIGYLIYVNQPSTKFTKANMLLNQNRFTEAQAIFNQIILKHPLAVTKYAECFFLQGKALQKKNKTKEAINYYNKAIESKSLLNSKSDKKSYSNIVSKAYYEIATIQFNDIPRSNNVKAINSIKSNIDFIKNTKYSNLQQFKDLIRDYELLIEDIHFEIASNQLNGISKENNISSIHAIEKNINYIKQLEYNHLKRFKDLIKNHKVLIGNIYSEIGKNNERKGDYNQAKNDYSKALNFLGKTSRDTESYDTLLRIEICRLKSNEGLNNIDYELIEKASKNIQDDYYYRYVIFLLKNSNFKDAEIIIDKRLNNNSLEIQSLKGICLNEKIKLASNEINDINTQIKNLNTTSTKVDDILLLYNSISEKAKELNEVIPGVQKELEGLKPSLFNRILQSYTEQKEFGKIINLITGYPEFYKSPVLLKNIGNSCVNYLGNNSLTIKNYKLFVALFLTSAYSDNVMLYSLEYTSWDDEYTFSLADSIGSSYENHSQLPENVNYDEITETIISIGESQRFLISQLESLLNGQDIDSSLSERIHNFYDSEKKAIESIVSIIPNEIIFTTPHFAKKFKIEKEILSELEDDYNKYGNEDALRIGELYNSNNSSSTISEFSLAKEILDNILSSIKTINKPSFEKHTSKKNIGILKKYSSIFDDAEIKMVEVIDSVSKKDSENENLLNLMQSVIKISPTKDKLKYQFVNYASNLCVSKINAEKMTNYKGLQIMNNSYKLLPNDARVCTNIIALIRMNILDILNNRSDNPSSIYSILDDIKNNRSNSFKHNAGELVKARNEILSGLPAEARTSIISGIDLNSQGRQLKKGLDYLGKLGGSSTIKDPLAALRERLGFDL